MYPLLVFDSSINLLAEIDDYEYLCWTYKWRKFDNYILKVNRYKNNVEFLSKGNLIAILRNGEYKVGIIERRELALDQEGKISEILNIIGRGLDGLCEERIALHNTTIGNGYDEQDTNAESAMKHYVDVNMINAVDPDRNISLLELEPNQARGSEVSYRGRFQSISKVLEEISLVSGLGWGVTLDITNKKFVFKVYEGLDRSSGNGLNSTVIFSPEFDNTKLLNFIESMIDSKNTAYVGDQETAQNRTVVKVTKDDEIFIGLNRREFFIDARDKATSEQLGQKGKEQLAEKGEEIAFEIENLSTGPFELGVDFNMGDIVTINYPDVAIMDSRIIEVVEEITPESGLTNKLTFGRELPDLLSLIKQDRNNFDPEIRR